MGQKRTEVNLTIVVCQHAHEARYEFEKHCETHVSKNWAMNKGSFKVMNDHREIWWVKLDRTLESRLAGLQAIIRVLDGAGREIHNRPATYEGLRHFIELTNSRYVHK